jgi:hypothetical protein
MNWQLIETAPKDGTLILVFYRFATVPMAHLAYWDDDEYDDWEKTGFPSKEEKVGWWSFVENSVAQHKLCGANTPTHWAPCGDLPDAD